MPGGGGEACSKPCLRNTHSVAAQTLNGAVGTPYLLSHKPHINTSNPLITGSLCGGVRKVTLKVNLQLLTVFIQEHLL